MPAKFDFLSPEVLLREIDQSQIPSQATEDGICIIGTAPAGPALKPVRVRDLDSFLSTFGYPSSGKSSNDIYRNGSFGPTYGMYAAQAWLSAESSPVTFVRLLGEEDASASGLRVGWDTGQVDPTTSESTNGGAYGLWIAPSSSTAANAKPGCLAAIIYVETGSLTLKGTEYRHGLAGSAANKTGEAIKSIDKNDTHSEFEINHKIGSTTTSYIVNFDKNASNSNPNYIRSVIPTNPEKLNSKIYSTTNKLFLGQTFDEMVERNVKAVQSAKEKQYGVLVHMGNGTEANAPGWSSWRQPATAPKSGWFFAQDMGEATSFLATNQQQLFRICGLHEGEWLQRNYQIGIEIASLGNNINPYGSFHVFVMDMEGEKVEQYKNCNFNIASANYIAKKIGDQRQEWDDDQKKYRVLGDYENRSDLVYVEVSEAVANGSLASLGAVPFGVQGPIKYTDFYAMQDPTCDNLSKDSAGNTDWEFDGQFAQWDSEVVSGSANDEAHDWWGHTVAGMKTQYQWPSLRLTTTSSAGTQSTDYKTSDWLGVNHTLSGSTRLDESYYDLVKAGPNDGTNSLSVTASEGASPVAGTEFSYMFTLDDVRYDDDTKMVWFESGSRQDNSAKSYTALNNTDKLINTIRVRKYVSPLFGGADGVNIKEANPFANHAGAMGSTSNDAEISNYTIYSVMKALDTVSDKEIVAYDVLSVPGVTNTKITDRVLEICSDRADSLGIIDLQSGFQPAQVENTGNVNGSVKETINDFVARDINTSYGAAYYPWIRLRDTLSGNGDVIMAPPSVAAIGAIARSEAVSEPWFAPAGFNRGGIRQLGGIKGPQCVGTWEHLTKLNRDDLYEKNINPIARFPAINEIVIFGQKTLQQTQSALDRINVRRLMIYLKKTIGKIADTILFDNNVRATWLRFRGETERVLESVQTRLGITEYKLVLDETTTTPDLIDRNIMYAKIFVKPARAIEFIVIDFVITRTGVEF